MNYSEIHLEEVIQVKEKNDSYKYYRPEQIYLYESSITCVKISKDDYIRLCKSVAIKDRLVAGYFKTVDDYYYLEKIKSFYILSKKARDREIKVLLDEKHNTFFETGLSFSKFKTFCKEMDEENGLFIYEEEENN